MKVALIGFSHGHQGAYGGALFRHPLAEPVGVAEEKDAPDFARELARQFAKARGVPFYEDFEAMIEETRPEAVSVAARPERQNRILGALAERRIHIMCEKPLLFARDGLTDLLQKIRRAGVVFAWDAPSAVWSFGIQEMLTQVRRGVIGAPRVINARYLAMDGPLFTFQEDKGRKILPPVGEVGNFLPYVYWPVRLLFGARPLEAAGELRGFFYDHYRPEGLEDFGVVQMSFPCGGVANLTLGRVPTKTRCGRDYSFEVLGDQGTLFCPQAEGAAVEIYGEKKSAAQCLYNDAVGPYVDDFVRCVREGAESRLGLDAAAEISEIYEMLLAQRRG